MVFANVRNDDGLIQLEHFPSQLCCRAFGEMEFKSDRVVFHGQDIRPGTHRAFYYATVVYPGVFTVPSVKVVDRYNQTVLGYSSDGFFTVGTLENPYNYNDTCVPVTNRKIDYQMLYAFVFDGPRLPSAVPTLVNTNPSPAIGNSPNAAFPSPLPPSEISLPNPVPTSSISLLPSSTPVDNQIPSPSTTSPSTVDNQSVAPSANTVLIALAVILPILLVLMLIGTIMLVRYFRKRKTYEVELFPGKGHDMHPSQDELLDLDVSSTEK